ncbi:unnamed protein product, partial [Discosporangium mesarthrocarpum]
MQLNLATLDLDPSEEESRNMSSGEGLGNRAAAVVTVSRVVATRPLGEGGGALGPGGSTHGPGPKIDGDDSYGEEDIGPGVGGSKHSVATTMSAHTGDGGGVAAAAAAP